MGVLQWPFSGLLAYGLIGAGWAGILHTSVQWPAWAGPAASVGAILTAYTSLWWAFNLNLGYYNPQKATANNNAFLQQFDAKYDTLPEELHLDRARARAALENLLTVAANQSPRTNWVLPAFLNYYRDDYAICGDWVDDVWAEQKKYLQENGEAPASLDTLGIHVQAQKWHSWRNGIHNTHFTIEISLGPAEGDCYELDDGWAWWDTDSPNGYAVGGVFPRSAIAGENGANYAGPYNPEF